MNGNRNKLRIYLLNNIRENIVEGVNKDNLSMVEQGLNLYDRLVQVFIDRLKDWGARYTKKSAEQEINSLGGGWSEVRWIKDDLRNIIDKALAKKSSNTIEEILYFPVRIVQKAFLEQEYYIFNEFIGLIKYSYAASVRCMDEEEQKKVAERYPRMLKEVTDYIFTPLLERSDNIEEITNRGEFAVGIVLLFQDLLKYSFDQKLSFHFDQLNERLSKLFNRYSEFVVEVQHEYEKYELFVAKNIDKREKKEDIKKELIDNHRTVAAGIEDTRQIVQYGLNSWILRKYNSGFLTIEDFKKWNEKFAISSSIQDTWVLYLKARSRSEERGFDWEFWELSEHPEGQIATIDFDRYLRLLCCIRFLKLLKGMTKADRQAVKLKPSPQILELAENNDSPFLKTLKEIEDGADKWIPVLERNGLEQVPTFLGILRKTVEAQEEVDTVSLITASLDEGLVERFKKDFIDEWKKDAHVRRMIESLGGYKYVPKQQDNKIFFGINILDRKDVYVSESRIYKEDWGKQHGRATANGENNHILEKIINFSTNVNDDGIPTGHLLNGLDDASIRLLKSKYEPIVLVLNSWQSLYAIQASPSFEEKRGQLENTELAGYFKRMPVYNMHYSGEPVVIIIDLKRFGIWEQYRPKHQFPDEEDISKEFAFHIKIVTLDIANDLIEKQKGFLVDKEGMERNREEVLRELQQRVQLRIIEQFEYKLLDKRASRKIVVI